MDNQKTENPGHVTVNPQLDIRVGQNDGIFFVTFQDGDPEDPQNYSKKKKAIILIGLVLMAFCTAFGSSLWAAAQIGGIEEDFDISKTVGTLGVALYLIGFGAGPLIWGPMTEIVGRRIPYWISWPLFCLSNIATAWGDSIGVLVFFRFLSGCFAACALNNAGGLIQDMYEGRARQKASGLFILSAFGGPTFGPLVGSFTTVLLDWRWTMRILFIFSAALLPVAVLLPETLGTKILEVRSKKLRAQGSKNAWAAHEVSQTKKSVIVKDALIRQFKMLCAEPISVLISAYLAVAYSIIYVLLYAWGQTYAIREPFVSNPQKLGLVFLAQFIGMLIGLGTVTPLSEKLGRLYVPLISPPERKGRKTDKLRPEDKVKIAIPASILLTGSQFWWAFTVQNEDLHYMVSVASGLVFGFGFIQLFMSLVVYGMDVYNIYTPSFLAASALSRSLIAGIFSLVCQKMLKGMGEDWTIAFMGFLSVALLPAPIIFARFGRVLEEKSPLATEARKITENTKTMLVDGSASPQDASTPTSITK